MSAATEKDVPIDPVIKTVTPASRGVRIISQTIGSRVFIQGLNILTGIMTARILAPAGRGQLAAITLWSSLLAGMTTFGLPSALIYYIRNRPKQTETLMVNSLFMSTVLSIIVAIVGAICMPMWLHQYPLWAIHAAQWFLIVTPLCSTTLIFRGGIEATGAFSTSNVAQILNPAVILTSLLILLATHHFNTLTASSAYIFAAIPPFFLLAWRSRKLFGSDRRISFTTQKLLLSYGIRSYGIDLIGALALQVDQVLVVSFLRPADLGVYVVMLSLSRMLNIFQASVVTVLFPKATGLSTEQAVAMTARAARVSTAITSLCALCIAILGPVLLRIFYGAEYAKSALTLRLLLVEVTIAGCAFVLAQAFMALGKPGLVTFLQGVGLAVSVPMMFLLIPRWGTMGAAVALLISTLTRLALIYGSFIFVLKVRPPSLFVNRDDFNLLLSALRKKGVRV